MSVLQHPRINEIRSQEGILVIMESTRNLLLTDMSAVSTVVTKNNISKTFSNYAKELLTKVDKFKSLKKGFDSYNADAPSKESIESAIIFIKYADQLELPLYFVAPGKNGEVLVELHDRLHKSVELYFNSDGTQEQLHYLNNKCVYDGGYDRKLLSEFIKPGKS